MTLRKFLPALPFLLLPAALLAQGKGVPPEDLLKPLKDSWPTYNGDYTGRRYSTLTQLNRSNVMHLTLAWTTRVTAGGGNTADNFAGRGGGGGGRGGRGGGRRQPHRRRRRPRRPRHGRRQYQGLRARSRWHPLLHHAR